MARELTFDLGLEPLLGFVVLAGGAVAIATRAKELLGLGATLTLVESNPTGFGPTGHDGVNDFAMVVGHSVEGTRDRRW